MLSWLPDFLSVEGWTWSTGLWALALGLVLLLAGSTIVIWVVLRLPTTYLCPEQPGIGPARRGAWHWTCLVGKNLLGLVLVVCGAVLSLPGVPGPGLLLVLAGITMLNFPGKRRLERKLLGRPAVFHALNRLRARFGKPPLVSVAEGDPSRRTEPRAHGLSRSRIRRAHPPRF